MAETKRLDDFYQGPDWVKIGGAGTLVLLGLSFGSALSPDADILPPVLGIVGGIVWLTSMFLAADMWDKGREAYKAWLSEQSVGYVVTLLDSDDLSASSKALIIEYLNENQKGCPVKG